MIDLTLWTASGTLNQVFMRGMIWLEGYEAHLRTSQPMSRHLSERDDRCQSIQIKYRKMFLDCRNVSFLGNINLNATHKWLGFSLAMFLLKLL